jgi:hypothetical protein
MNCISCGQSLKDVAAIHEKSGHNIQCTLRHDIVPDENLCEDCIDDILEDMSS